MLTHAVFNALGGHVRGDNIFILRRQSSWANADTLVEFVRLLSKVLEPLAQRRHVVITLDACPVHLSARVARACARACAFLNFVPAHMTAWLQPLGAYVFLPLKRFIRRGHHALQVASVSGSVSTLQSMELLCRAIHCVLNEQAWAWTFCKKKVRPLCTTKTAQRALARTLAMGV